VGVEALAALIRERQPCVALTGAGVSTETGIPDFRSPHGLWAEFDPMEYGSLRAFQQDPEKVWQFYGRATRRSPTPSRTPRTSHSLTSSSSVCCAR